MYTLITLFEIISPDEPSWRSTVSRLRMHDCSPLLLATRHVGTADLLWRRWRVRVAVLRMWRWRRVALLWSIIYKGGAASDGTSQAAVAAHAHRRAARRILKLSFSRHLVFCYIWEIQGSRPIDLALILQYLQDLSLLAALGAWLGYFLLL